MTVEQWLTKIIEFSDAEVDRLCAGKTTRAEINSRVEKLFEIASMELTPEQGEELVNGLMLYEQTIADEMAAQGRPVPGIDRQRPN